MCILGQELYFILLLLALGAIFALCALVFAQLKIIKAYKKALENKEEFLQSIRPKPDLIFKG